MPKPFSPLLKCGLMLCLIPFSLGQEKISLLPKGFLMGRVTSEKGEPLAGVKVERQYGWTFATDSDGIYYSFVQQNPILPDDKFCCGIRFNLPGFKTQTKTVSPDAHRLDVVLQSGDNRWIPPICDASPEGKKRVGWKMKLLIPKRARVEEIRGDDVFCRYIFWGYEKDDEKMEICSGPLWLVTMPPKDLLMSSSATQERYHPDREAFDYRGLGKEGNRWRYAGWLEETIEYRNASEQAANFFDSIIDNICWDAVAWPEDK